MSAYGFAQHIDGLQAVKGRILDNKTCSKAEVSAVVAALDLALAIEEHQRAYAEVHRAAGLYGKVMIALQPENQ